LIAVLPELMSQRPKNIKNDGLCVKGDCNSSTSDISVDITLTLSSE